MAIDSPVGNSEAGGAWLDENMLAEQNNQQSGRL